MLEQAERFPDGVSAGEVKKRRDFRDVLTFTIDPVDAKDFDDALSIQKLENGFYEIGVHIADVSHYVEPGTALDDEAYARATSVYLPDRVLPMLPERSNGSPTGQFPVNRGIWNSINTWRKSAASHLWPMPKRG